MSKSIIPTVSCENPLDNPSDTCQHALSCQSEPPGIHQGFTAVGLLKQVYSNLRYNCSGWTPKGPGFSICLHQKGLVPLHVCTKRAWCLYMFAPKGPGVSTCLHQKGLVPLYVCTKRAWCLYMFAPKGPGESIFLHQKDLVSLYVYTKRTLCLYMYSVISWAYMYPE